MRYDPSEIEPRWQRSWDEQDAFRTPHDLATLRRKPKFYVLDMFPYPSGAGLHVGHAEGYTATDVVARHKRMTGHHVLHPMGWDAFGLPAERAAMRENIHPAIITERNVDNFRRQIRRLGFSYDWKRELSTSDPAYYRWTQWIFLQLMERDLAYLAEVPVNWCPALGTVLANEEVKDGKYVETGDPVERRDMRQWMLKITAYAERLLDDLDDLDWPDSVKEMQRNWIGKSVGAEIDFVVDADGRAGDGESFTVFTTRPDTLFGATYCVLAPEHPLALRIASDDQRAAVTAYVEEATQKTDLARTDLAKSKTGVDTGASAIHPVTGARLPIWVADYVLMTYGTGAIMAVPGHDTRDHEFARAFELPIVEVISGGAQPIEDEAWTGEGHAVNSDFLDGMAVDGAKQAMTAWLEEHSAGRARVQYKLRDWLFSRQRYWGEPFPIVHLDDGTVVPLPADALPVALPPIDAYKPTPDGRPPLARAGDDWLMVELPDGRRGVRETNTMPQWAGSCWYYLRFLDPLNAEQAFDPELEKYWLPIDLYVGGVEHAVLHLLYARFWHKVLYDCGVVSTKEPFQRLFNQGMILGSSYRDLDGKYHHPSTVEERDGAFFAPGDDRPLDVQIERMGKSKLNGVDPMDVIAEVGADTVRLYELFMGPLEQTKPWQTEGVEGIFKFLGRVWRTVVDERTGEAAAHLVDEPADSAPELNKLLHQTIRKVGDDTEGLRFNTAISQMMIFTNAVTQADRVPRSLLLDFCKLLSPYAAHLAEELWSRLGGDGLVCQQDWPSYDEELVAEDLVTIVVQVNGKRRDEFEVARGADREALQELALATEGARRFVGDSTPRKVIVVPDRLVNVVV
ncbi:MAG: leucine--tRNA ligase [Acidobacteriota bacterium]